MRGRIGATLAALLVGAVQFVTPAIVTAHCPGGPADQYWRAYASGGQSVSGAVALRGTIQWTNPNPCTRSGYGGPLAFSAEAVSLGRTGSNDGFVQVGWVKREGYTGPKMYCEFSPKAGAPGPYKLIEFTLPSASTFQYRAQHSVSTGAWYCYLGSTSMWSVADSKLGFSSGTYALAQGEVNSTHGQIGKIEPSKLEYSSIQYQVSSGTWTTVNLGLNSPPSVYGVDEPSTGWMRNWTDADH